jgi:hypothetical protein
LYRGHHATGSNKIHNIGLIHLILCLPQYSIWIFIGKYVFNDFRQDEVVRFVDIGGIVEQFNFTVETFFS